MFLEQVSGKLPILDEYVSHFVCNSDSARLQETKQFGYLHFAYTFSTGLGLLGEIIVLFDKGSVTFVIIWRFPEMGKSSMNHSF